MAVFYLVQICSSQTYSFPLSKSPTVFEQPEYTWPFPESSPAMITVFQDKHFI
jgi:hypothetical protein